jgi:hypothetical protein
MLLGLKTLASFLVETRRTRRRHLLYVVSHFSVLITLYVSQDSAYRNALFML